VTAPALTPLVERPEETPPPAARRRRRRTSTSLTPVAGLGLGVAMIWFSLLVLIPLIAILVQASEGGWAAYWQALTSEQTAAALRLTVTQAFLVTLVNIVMGTTIAWVLVRDRFRGKQVLEVVIDIPFALPTIVAGMVLLSLYGPSSPLGVDWANTRVAVFLAFLFVTLPFVVRTVQPVLAELEPEVEEAAASLGASRFTTFRTLIIPALAPAITSGAALSFARGISEYGSLVLLSGNLPYSTEVASVRILSYVEGDKLTDAAAVASILLVVALVVIVALDIISRRVARHG
jgi:sulfate/thiosulfate transport system permease protein